MTLKELDQSLNVKECKQTTKSSFWSEHTLAKSFPVYKIVKKVAKAGHEKDLRNVEGEKRIDTQTKPFLLCVQKKGHMNLRYKYMFYLYTSTLSSRYCIPSHGTLTAYKDVRLYRLLTSPF